MKYILFLFLLSIPCLGYSQYSSEIKLSKTLDESRMGLWTNGDYKMYIELNTLESSFRNTYNSYNQSTLRSYTEDTVTSKFYLLTAQRYLLAADLLKNAESGFNLRSLIIYFGVEDKQYDLGNSYIVGRYVTQMVESGNAAVYYKGERIYTLQRLITSQGHGLDYGYDALIYYDDKENCAITYYQHLGW